MDDVLPPKVQPTSFAYLLAFAATVVLALAWDDAPSPAGHLHELALAPAMLAPLLTAMRGASLGASYTETAALSTLAVVAMAAGGGSSEYRLDSPLAVALMVFMALSLGGTLAGVFELVAAPFKARIRDALRDGVQRVVPRECLLVVLYCAMASMHVCRESVVTGEAQFTRKVLALDALMGAATLVSLAWELRLRLRVRAILAGRVPGWRAVELPDDAPRAVPTLRWLDDPGWVSRHRAVRRGRDRAIVRDEAPDVGVYRAQPRTSQPYVVVPARVSLTCAHSAFCAALFLTLANVSAMFVEARREFGPGVVAAEADAAIAPPQHPSVRATSTERSPRGALACLPSRTPPESFADHGLTCERPDPPHR